MAQVICSHSALALLQMADSATCYRMLYPRLRAHASPQVCVRSEAGLPECTCSAWRSFLRGLAMFFGGASLPRVPGQGVNFTGRTDIWAAVIPRPPTGVGAGFESFWISPDGRKYGAAFSGWWHPEGLNEAHDGYIEVYLNLGWIGVCLIALILISGYRRAVKASGAIPLRA